MLITCQFLPENYSFSVSVKGCSSQEYVHFKRRKTISKSANFQHYGRPFGKVENLRAGVLFQCPTKPLQTRSEQGSDSFVLFLLRLDLLKKTMQTSKLNIFHFLYTEMLLKKELPRSYSIQLIINRELIFPSNLGSILNMWGCSWLSQWGSDGAAVDATVIQWIEVGNVAKHPTMHKAVPTRIS